MNELGYTLAIRFRITRLQRAFMYILGSFSMHNIKLCAKRLPKFSTILSEKSSKVMHSSLLKFLQNARFPAHSFVQFTFLHQWLRRLKSSQKKIPSDSASDSLQQCIIGTIPFRIALSMNNTLKFGTLSLHNSFKKWNEYSASFAEFMMRGYRHNTTNQLHMSYWVWLFIWENNLGNNSPRCFNVCSFLSSCCSNSLYIAFVSLVVLFVSLSISFTVFLSSSLALASYSFIDFISSL